MKKVMLGVLVLLLSVPAMAVTLGTSTQAVLPYGADIAWIAEVRVGGETIATFSRDTGVLIPEGAEIWLLRSASSYFKKDKEGFLLQNPVICLYDNERVLPERGAENQAFAWYRIRPTLGAHGICFVQIVSEAKPDKKPSVNFAFLVIRKEHWQKLVGLTEGVQGSGGEHREDNSQKRNTPTLPATSPEPSPVSSVREESLEGSSSVSPNSFHEEEDFAVVAVKSAIPRELAITFLYGNGEISGETIDRFALFELPPGKITMQVKEVEGWEITYPETFFLRAGERKEIEVRGRRKLFGTGNNAREGSISQQFSTLVVENRALNPCRIQLVRDSKVLLDSEGRASVLELAPRTTRELKVPSGKVRLELAPGWRKTPGLKWVLLGTQERYVALGETTTFVVTQEVEE